MVRFLNVAIFETFSLFFSHINTLPDNSCFCYVHRSKSEVPLKLKGFAIWLTDSNLNYKLNTNSFMEVKLKAESNPKPIDSNFMVEPNKCYKFLFSANEYKFVENSELSVSVCCQP